jgi:hypothetical protein
MFKAFSILYGIVFTALGILGFIPFIAPEGLLFLLFKVNSATNIIHFLTGIVGLLVVVGQSYYERIYFQIIGFVYAILALFGFVYGADPVLGFIANNCPLTWFHMIAAVGALILGFGTPNTLEKKGR